MQFENNYGVVAVQFLEEDRKIDLLGSSPRDSSKKGWILVGQGSSKEAFMASTDSHTLKRHGGGGSQQGKGASLVSSGTHTPAPPARPSGKYDL